MSKDSDLSTKTTPAAPFLQVLTVTVIAGGFFGITSPAPVSLLAVIAGSITLGALLYVWLALFVRLAAVFWPFPIRQQRILAVALSLTTMFLILMQSVGELSWHDALAAIPLVAILYVYTTYASSGPSAQNRQRH